jgi:hypothetical protein
MKSEISKNILIAFCALIFLSNHCFAQSKNEIFVDAGFLQVKEELNQSMVYHGLQIGFHYRRNIFFERWELRYKAKAASGIPFDRGMMAVTVHFVPVDFSGLVPVYKNGRHHLKAGLNLAANYSYQTYPEQHSAHLFWYGEIGIAPCMEYGYQWKKSRMRIFLQNSIAGFVSRTREVTPYFYSFEFSDFFTQPHENMKFGSFDKFNHTSAVIECTPNISKGHSFAFGAEYTDCYSGNRFQSLNYYLQWKKAF